MSTFFLGAGVLKSSFEVLPEFAWMNVYGHRFSALTLSGHGELWNKEHSEPQVFRPSQPGKGQHEDLMHPLPEHCHQWLEYPPLWSSLPWPDPWFSLQPKQIPEEPLMKSGIFIR